MDEDSLHLRNLVGEEIIGATLPLAWDPRGNGNVRLICATCLGYVQNNWRFEIHKPVADNTFELETVLSRTTDWVGNLKGGIGDTDLDGREEAFLSFYPHAILFEWGGVDYDSTWTLHQQQDTGSLRPNRFPIWDLNNDLYPEWILVDHWDTCYIYGYNFIPPLAIHLEPDSVVIPRGEKLSYLGALENNSPERRAFQVWAMLRDPNGQPYGPVLGPRHIIMYPHSTREKRILHTIPEYTPLGDYTYIGNLGNYPYAVTASDSFNFTVIP
jgi:hypothetical protein